MTFKELFSQDDFSEIFGEVERFSKSKLKKYNDEISKKKLTKNPKEIFDAVWGNIEFSAGEIYILDSPLLQRLRHIKQLGFADFVYCGCDYSRFYHTIGVVYLADRMATAINKCEFDSKPESKKFFNTMVRLAAIFHDTGHMFFSHVSEHYFGKSCKYYRHEYINNMMQCFERVSGKRIALHELISCMLVNTTEVRRLLELVGNRIPNISIDDIDYDKVTEYISCLISGVPIDSQVLPYSSIINGSIDADKCDYLSRDSHVTRVPVAVDISRITQKLSVVKSEEINKSNLWKVEAGPNEAYYELAMQDSAEKALFQLCIARTIMYDSVYYHHKVLTAETEFRNILNQLTHLKHPIFMSFDEILSFTDYDFSEKTFELWRLKVTSEADKAKLQKIYNQLENLYNRVLAKRVVCILPEYLEGSQKDTESLHEKVLTYIDSPDAEELINKIKREYIYIKQKLIPKDSAQDINIYIIQAPIAAFGHSKIQVPIDLHNGNKREFKGYEMVSSKETSSSASYIVSDAPYKELVYLAFEKVLFDVYRLRVKAEGYACGKYDRDCVIDYANRLFKMGYYDECSVLIRDDIVYSMLPRRKVKEIVEKYSSYEGIDGYKISEEAIYAYVKQVMGVVSDKAECKSVVSGICQLLRDAIIINRKYFSDAMKEKLRDTQFCGNVNLIPLGGTRDSAHHYAYYFNDVFDSKIDMDKSLKEVLQDSTVSNILFFDDGSYSGTQLLSIIQEYMGIEKRATKEHHVEPLTSEQCEIWKSKKTIFLFVAFNKENEEELRKEILKTGLSDFNFVYDKDLSKKCFSCDSYIKWENDSQRESTKKVLESIGYELMMTSKCQDGVFKKNWNEERVKAAALGYNDAQQMVVLTSSIPTYTIVAFWQSGKVNGKEWKPLFFRTKKPD